jgi:hypothetical protein
MSTYFKNHTLITLGCSHTFGTYINESGTTLAELESCHARSWSRKLKKIGGFDREYNLSLNGGSNERSIRVLLNFLQNTNEKNEMLTVLFPITEPIRFEIGVDTEMKPAYGKDFQATLSKASDMNDQYRVLKVGPWELNPPEIFDKDYHDYVKLRYGFFDQERFVINKLRQQIVMLSGLLTTLKIRHYFFNGLSEPENYESVFSNYKIPYIRFFGNPIVQTNGEESFRQTNAFGPVGFLRMMKGFKTGEDFVPESKCRHFSDDANQFLAEYLFEEMCKLRALENQP